MSDDEDDAEIERERARDEASRKDMITSFAGLSSEMRDDIAAKVAASFPETVDKYQFYRRCAQVADLVWLARGVMKGD